MILLAVLAVVLLVVAFYLLTMSEQSQILGKILWHGPRDSRLIALTFDDGPNEPYTSELLDVLDKHQVKASFFVVGSNLVKSPASLQRAFKAGHTIGNHSYSHSFRKYFYDPSFATEINKNMAAIEAVIGKKPALYRSPWLFRQPLLLATVRRLGLTPVFGLFCSEREIFQPPAGEMADRAFARAANGAILIFHDGYNAKGANREQTVACIDLLIPRLREAGYALVTVDALLGVKAYL